MLLEKWQCHKCERSFLLIAEQTKGVSIRCNFCGSMDHVETVARQNPEIDYESELGCLWPDYNEVDKLAYSRIKASLP